MSGNGKTEMVKIILDDEEVEVPAGINLIEAAALHGKEVPHYCYHPGMSSPAMCRLCLIDRSRGAATLVRAATEPC